jgi:Carboxyl transferase domain
LSEVPFSAIYHGPLPRAAQTAELVAACSPGVPLSACDLAGDYLPSDPDLAGLPSSFASFVAGFSAAERAEGPALAIAALDRFARAGDEPDDTYELVVTHNFLIGWLVSQALGAPSWRWLGLNQMKGAEAVTRLADLCSTFHLPVVTFTDQPGLLIGTRAEQRATIRHGVRAISAIYQSTVPGAEVIVRRVFGVGGAGMTNRHRLIRRWAWPSADWGSLPVEGGTEAAYRAELERADDPAAALASIRARLDAVRSPLRTAERFGIEEIIDPRETRPLLCDWVRDAYAVLPASPGRPSFGTRP